MCSGKMEPQVVPFPLGWTTDPAGMVCKIALFQERTAWANKPWKTLSLLFPLINDPESLKLPQSVKSQCQNSNYTSCLSRWGGIGVSGECIQEH
jgi:hypothetical protein